MTALREAAWMGHTQIVRLLLNAPGIDVNVHNILGMTAFLSAAAKSHTEIVKLLLNVPGICQCVPVQYTWHP